jgi:hypothetical protein
MKDSRMKKTSCLDWSVSALDMLAEAGGLCGLIWWCDLERFCIHSLQFETWSVGLNQVMSNVCKHLLYTLACLTRGLVCGTNKIVTLFTEIKIKSSLCGITVNSLSVFKIWHFCCKSYGSYILTWDDKNYRYRCNKWNLNPWSLLLHVEIARMWKLFSKNIPSCK